MNIVLFQECTFHGQFFVKTGQDLVIVESLRSEIAYIYSSSACLYTRDCTAVDCSGSRSGECAYQTGQAALPRRMVTAAVMRSVVKDRERWDYHHRTA